jgi:hypothetical protein
VAVAIALNAAACANSPSGPTPVTVAAPVTVASANNFGAPADLAQCLGGSAQSSCFTAVGLRAMSADPPAITSTPVLNSNQPLLNSGSTVTLSWTGTGTTFLIEASSSPGGPANLASFNTGSASTLLAVPNVPAGTYYVRIRSVDASGASAPSNEVQVVVANAPAPSPGGACPSAPVAFVVASQVGGAVTFAWQPPSSGAPTSYVVQAGSAPGASNLVTLDTGSTTPSFTPPTVPPGSYYLRVYARSSSCAAPAFLSPPSNEILLTVGGGTPAWSGQIACRIAVGGPGYRHDETQTWTITGPGQPSGPRTLYPLRWTAQGSGSAVGQSWTINSSATTDLTVTTVASTGIPIFDRTTTPILIARGIVGTLTNFDLHEIDFQTIVASSPTATSVNGTWSRPTNGGDSPVQPGMSTGTLSCNWSFIYR